MEGGFGKGQSMGAIFQLVLFRNPPPTPSRGGESDCAGGAGVWLLGSTYQAAPVPAHHKVFE